MLVELEALQERIAEFIRSVLICLSTIESEDILPEKGERREAPES